MPWGCKDPKTAGSMLGILDSELMPGKTRKNDKAGTPLVSTTSTSPLWVEGGRHLSPTKKLAQNLLVSSRGRLEQRRAQDLCICGRRIRLSSAKKARHGPT
eukprot:scaffold3581_cov252-Pinguiococcus_pyrenoidosus.AAC.23